MLKQYPYTTMISAVSLMWSTWGLILLWLIQQESPLVSRKLSLMIKTESLFDISLSTDILQLWSTTQLLLGLLCLYLFVHNTTDIVLGLIMKSQEDTQTKTLDFIYHKNSEHNTNQTGKLQTRTIYETH